MNPLIMKSLGVLLLLATACADAAAMAEPRSTAHRIVGGSETNIQKYPYMAGMLSSNDLIWYTHNCGGTIINSRSILSAAHCYDFLNRAEQWRVRVGSTYANSGGIVHQVVQIISHPAYNSPSIFNNDVAILRLATNIQFSSSVAMGNLAGANYALGDNHVVYAIGWGHVQWGGPYSEILREVQIWTVNQQICANRYRERGTTITAGMLCSGWLDVGGRDQCQNDSGGPLIHNNVVVGVCSFGIECAHPYFPGVNARVSYYINWIIANA